MIEQQRGKKTPHEGDEATAFVMSAVDFREACDGLEDVACLTAQFKPSRHGVLQSLAQKGATAGWILKLCSRVAFWRLKQTSFFGGTVHLHVFHPIINLFIISEPHRALHFLGCRNPINTTIEPWECLSLVDSTGTFVIPMYKYLLGRTMLKQTFTRLRTLPYDFSGVASTACCMCWGRNATCLFLVIGCVTSTRRPSSSEEGL